MYKLPAPLRRVSDTVFIALTTSILGALIFCWYLWWYMPLGISIDALEKQNTRVCKHITSLEKKLTTSSWVTQELLVLEGVFMQRAFEQEPEAFAKLLASVKKSGIRLRLWKPGKKKEYGKIVMQLLEIEVEGTYEQLVAVLEGAICSEFLLTKTAQGIHGKCLFEVASKGAA